MIQNNLFGSGGFRLDSFQFCNWGLFDRRIYSMPCNGQSALLTGDNGSGKTTLVDAIVSLLVPPGVRFYNQSSGTNQRRERTEESYILGACNTKREEGNYTAQAEYLRTKQDSLSCLLGIFGNSGTGAAVTLFQVRYFSAEGKLQQVYAIAQRAVPLKAVYDTLTERDALFDRQGKWKKVLQESFEFVFFGDYFKKYSARFSQIFGFRSDKALNLFSQTVGVKVLDNLNEFIRTKMFEQCNMEDEFAALHDNYSNLLNSYNEIEKTQEQLRLLQPVLESGRKLDAEKRREAEYAEYNTTAALWFSRSATALTEADLAAEQGRRNIDEAKQQELEIRINGLDMDVQELRAALAKNEVHARIQRLDDRIAQAVKDRTLIQAARETYRRIAAAAGCPVPDTAERFERNRQTLQGIAQECRRAISELKESWAAAAAERNTIDARIQDVTGELASLAGRQSNIPSENVRIREQICRDIGCAETDIPFAGELMQVSPEEEYWAGALEKLLRHFGLSLIVPEELYRKVNAFVHGNNLKGRVVYFRADERANLMLKGAAPGSAAAKLLVKQDHPLASWVEQYIADRFDYLCTDDMKEFARAERAVTGTGLIKSKNRHEKDDRSRSGALVRILGWDNRAKRQELSEQLDELTGQRETAAERAAGFDEQERAEQAKIAACGRLLEFGNWTELDLKTITASIDSCTKERDNLLNSAGELKLLTVQLETRARELQEARQERDEIIRAVTSRKDRIRDLEEKLAEYRGAAAVFDGIPGTDEKIAAFAAALKLGEPARTVRQLEAARDAVRTRIQEETVRCGNSIKTHTANITKYMAAFRHPDRVLAGKYSSWEADVSHLSVSPDCIDDYRRMAEKLEKDDLPRYKKEFHTYLNEQLSEGVINFHQTLEEWEQKIRTGIEELNRSLRLIPYNTEPETYLALDCRLSNDQRIKEFSARKHAAIPDMGRRYAKGSDESYEAEEAEFLKIQELIGFLKEDDSRRKLVLDVRNWFDFSAVEYFAENNVQKQFYQNSASLSGGEKAKLAYTILASAIAFQFGINDAAGSDNSFRFVIIAEAFSKIDPRNSRYAMELFRLLDLQLLVVTPMDKINVVEQYVHSVHITENHGTPDSRLISMTLQEYRRKRAEYAQS